MGQIEHVCWLPCVCVCACIHTQAVPHTYVCDAHAWADACCAVCYVQVPIAVMVLLDPQVYSDTIYGHTQLSVLMCVISSGYFLHDLVIVLLRLDTEGAPMLVHACCCLFVYTYAVYSYYLTFYGGC